MAETDKMMEAIQLDWLNFSRSEPRLLQQVFLKDSSGMTRWQMVNALKGEA